MSINIGILEDKGKQKVKLDGAEKEVRVVERWFGKVPVNIYLDDNGKELGESGRDFEIKLSSKEKIAKQFK